MTRIKLCGITGMCDIGIINELKPEYIGFVFAPESRRWVSPETAAGLKAALSKDIQAVGVFVNEPAESVARLLKEGIIDIAQLHGNEDEDYIRKLRVLTGHPIIKAFRVESAGDIANAGCSSADYVLLDSGAGSGERFEWNWIKDMKRPFFLAGGLNVQNVATAVSLLHPFAVDTSSGIETNGSKDQAKMAAFVAAVRKEDRNDK